jgi:hypothetical protein
MTDPAEFPTRSQRLQGQESITRLAAHTTFPRERRPPPVGQPQKRPDHHAENPGTPLARRENGPPTGRFEPVAAGVSISRALESGTNTNGKQAGCDFWGRPEAKVKK